MALMAWILCGGAGITLALHAQALRRLAAGPAAADQEFRRQQLRRRTWASGLLWVLAVVMIAGSVIDWRDNPRIYLWVWSLAAWLALVVGVLAAVDLWHSRWHVRELLRQQHDARRALESELQQIRARRARGEGEPPGGDIAAVPRRPLV